MALTVTKLAVYQGQGQANLVCIKVVSAVNDYPTGGYAIPASFFGFNTFEADGFGTGLPPTAGSWALVGDGIGALYGVINPANGNLQLFVATTGVEAAANTNVAYTGFLEALGH